MPEVNMTCFVQCLLFLSVHVCILPACQSRLSTIDDDLQIVCLQQRYTRVTLDEDLKDNLR